MPLAGSAPATRCWSNARSPAAIFWRIAKSPSAKSPNRASAVSGIILRQSGSFAKTNYLPAGGFLECRGRRIEVVRRSARNLRTSIGFGYEMNLLLASLRRVELRIEPQSITEFLKWKNRMAEYNRGSLPEGIVPPEDEANFFLEIGERL